MYQTLKGLVLRQTDYLEHDRLLNVLTDTQGRVTLRARGVRSSRSPLKSACQLLAYSEFTVFYGKNSIVIQEAVPIALFMPLRSDLERLSLASYFAQVAEAVSQEDAPDEAMLRLCLHALHALCTREKRLVKAAFELRCACLAGYMPQLSHCPICGNPQPDRFAMGTVVCAPCAADGAVRHTINPDLLAAMRYLCTCPVERLFAFRLGEENLKQLERISQDFLLSQLDRGFSALDFYQSLLMESL